MDKKCPKCGEKNLPMFKSERTYLSIRRTVLFVRFICEKCGKAYDKILTQEEYIKL